MQIRLLGAPDTAVLERVAADDADFDVADRADDGEDDEAAIDPGSAAALLADPSVLYWGAFDGDEVIGMLHCQKVRKHGPQPLELLLYDIGVRTAARRRGVGRALLEAMTRWMEANGVSEVWLLGDNPGAVAFYEACGFTKGDQARAVYMTRET